MEQKKLHPSVLKFKEFVKNNPKIINEVRSGKSSWQDLYEDWYLLGEEDEKWNAFRSEHSTKGTSGNKESEDEKKGDWMSQLTGMAKKIDPGQMQVYINNASQALGAIQGLLSQFQGNSQPSQPKAPEGPKHPFMFRKD